MAKAAWIFLASAKSGLLSLFLPYQGYIPLKLAEAFPIRPNELYVVVIDLGGLHIIIEGAIPPSRGSVIVIDQLTPSVIDLEGCGFYPPVRRIGDKVEELVGIVTVWCENIGDSDDDFSYAYSNGEFVYTAIGTDVCDRDGSYLGGL